MWLLCTRNLAQQSVFETLAMHFFLFHCSVLLWSVLVVENSGKIYGSNFRENFASISLLEGFLLFLIGSILPKLLPFACYRAKKKKKCSYRIKGGRANHNPILLIRRVILQCIGWNFEKKMASFFEISTHFHPRHLWWLLEFIVSMHYSLEAKLDHYLKVSTDALAVWW